jgi:hypothetical protein
MMGLMDAVFVSHLENLQQGRMGCRLDWPIVCIPHMFTPESENWSMRHLYHHNCGYAYATILSLSS